MGYYVQTGKPNGKAEFIKNNFDGELIQQPKSFSEIPSDKGLICVVSNGNGMFEAAAFCYNELEFQEFSIWDGRPKTWVVIDRKKAEQLSGYRI